MKIFNIETSLQKNFLSFESNNIINLENIDIIIKLINYLEKRSIIISGKLFEKLFTLDRKDLKKIYNKLKNYYKARSGIVLNNELFFSDENIEKISNNLDLFDTVIKKQITTYFLAYNLDLVPDIFIDKKVLNKKIKIKKTNNITIIDYKNSEELKKLISDIVDLPIVFGKSEKNFIDKYIIYNYKNFIEILNKSNMKIKENNLYIVNHIGLLKSLELNLLKTTKDILRYILMINNYDYIDMPKKIPSIKFKRYQKTAIIKKLDKIAYKDLNETFSELYSKKSLWKTFIRHVHPFSYRYKKYKNIRKLFKLLIENNKLNYHNRLLAKYKEEKNIISLIDLLSDNGGYLIRHLDFIIRNSNNKTIKHLLDILDKIDLNSKLIIQIIPYLEYRSEKDLDYRYIKLKKKYIKVKKSLLKLNKHFVIKVNKKLFEKLEYNLKDKPLFNNNIKKIYIDNSIINYKIPLEMRDYSITKNGLRYSSGTRIKFKNDKKYLRIFTSWGIKEHVNKSKASFDIDLSGALIKDNIVDFVSYFNYTTDIAIHSGDFVYCYKWNNRNSVAEFIDIDLKKAKKNSYKYIFIMNNIYSPHYLNNSWDKDVKTISGIQFLNKRDISNNKKSVIDISNSFWSFELHGEKNVNIPFFIDIENSEIVILDQYYNSNIYNNIAIDNILGLKECFIEISKYYINMQEFLTIYCKVNNIEIVEDRKQSDIIIDLNYISDNLEKIVNILK